MLTGGIQLACDGAVHLAVVAHIHHRLRRKVLLPHDLDFGIHRPHGGFDQPVQRRNFPFSHLLLPFSGNNASRISRESKPKINKVSFQFRFAWYTGGIIIVERTGTFKGQNRIKCRGYTKKFFAPKISERECTYGKKFGDRKDGAKLRNIHAMHLVMPLMYPNRCDNEAFISERIDLTNVLAYLDGKNASDPDYKYNFFR